jgi:glycerate kinase
VATRFGRVTSHFSGGQIEELSVVDREEATSKKVKCFSERNGDVTNPLKGLICAARTWLWALSKSLQAV